MPEAWQSQAEAGDFLKRLRATVDSARAQREACELQLLQQQLGRQQILQHHREQEQALMMGVVPHTPVRGMADRAPPAPALGGRPGGAASTAVRRMELEGLAHLAGGVAAFGSGASGGGGGGGGSGGGVSVARSTLVPSTASSPVRVHSATVHVVALPLCMLLLRRCTSALLSVDCGVAEARPLFHCIAMTGRGGVWWGWGHDLFVTGAGGGGGQEGPCGVVSLSMGEQRYVASPALLVLASRRLACTTCVCIHTAPWCGEA